MTWLHPRRERLTSDLETLTATVGRSLWPVGDARRAANQQRLAVYDPAVRLSQLLGANRRYIDAHLPNIGKLLRAEIGDVIEESEVVVVGLSGPEIIKDLEQFCQPGQVVLDLVRIADGSAIRAEVQGLCW
jgi:GDP-mannose 6-dehydrogenase